MLLRPYKRTFSIKAGNIMNMNQFEATLQTILDKTDLSSEAVVEVKEQIIAALLENMELQWGVLFPHHARTNNVELNRSEDSARWNAKNVKGAVVMQRLIGGWTPSDEESHDDPNRYEWGYLTSDNRFRYSVYGRREAEKKVEDNPEYSLVKRRPGYPWEIVSA